MKRAAMLARIRSALAVDTAAAGARAEAVAARLIQPPRHPLPGFARLSGEERHARLNACLAAQGAEVLSIPNLAALPLAVASIMRDLATAAALAIGDDDRLAALDWPPAVRPLRWTAGQTLGDGTAALTHAVAAVAETGTLVFASGPASPASLAFLPEVHIAAVARESVVASFEDAFSRLALDIGETRWPRAVNLVSGPSRTGDIGGRIVKGAHGPRRLAVVIYG